MPSPPKPWEVNNAGGSTAAITSPSTAASAVSSSNDLAGSSAPPVPSRTNDALSRPGTTTGGYGTTGYGTTGYGSTGYGSTGYGSTGYGSTGYGGIGSSYGTGYNRYGTGYGSSYGGYGGMSSYGGMGGYSSYSPYNRFGSYGGSMYSSPYNRMGMNGGPGGPEEMGLMQRMETGTRPAFEVIEQIVGAFGGFAQMLDSTFMATHSSFMAMVGVAEQLGHLRSYLGQVFSIYALYRMIKRLFYKATGRVDPTVIGEMNLNEFQQFEQKLNQPKMSRKPIVFFFLMVIGLPYMMMKLINYITAKQKLQQQLGPNAGPAGLAQKIDPAKLEFARATYDFTAESAMELSLKKGDIVAILSKTDPVTNQASQWWRGRLRDGRMGMFPANYVEIVQKQDQSAEAAATAEAINNTLPAASG